MVVLGGIKDFHWPSNSANIFPSPNDQAPGGETSAIAQDPEFLMHPSASPSFVSDKGGQRQETVDCPSPGLLATYKLGGDLGKMGGKFITDGAVAAAVTAPGYFIPGAEPVAAAGTAAGAFGIGAGGLMSTGGGILQGVSGLGIGLQTGNWTPLAATIAPVVASKISPPGHLLGPTLEDQLQGYMEKRGPDLESCLGSAY